MADDRDTLVRLRDLRKRRGRFRSSHAASQELARLRSLLPRQSVERQLFELAEIDGLAYKAIAEELNVSERHIYRIRRRMIEMIDAGEASSGAVRAQDDGGLALVRLMIKYGKLKEAREAAIRLERSGLTPAMQLELLTLQSMIASESGAPEKASAFLSQANLLAEQTPVENRGWARRRIAIADAYITYQQGLYETTIERCESALEGSTSTNLRADQIPDLCRDLIFAGIVHQEGGSPERALAFLDAAERLLRRCAEPPFSEIAQIHIHRTFVLASIPSRLHEAHAQASRALTMSSTHGLVYEHVFAKLASGLLNELAGNVGGALNDVRHALDLGRVALSGDPLVRTHFVTSRIETWANSMSGTLEHVIQAKSLVPSDSLLGTIAHLVEARIQRAKGNINETIACATRAVDGFERRKSSTHYLGEAYLARAMAAHRLGKDVRDDADAAVTLLLRGGWITDQARAVEFAGKIGLGRSLPSHFAT